MPRVALATLGCKVNQFETESMEGLFKQAGYEIVPFEQVADVYVINTCSVTSMSDRKSRQMVRRAQHANPQAIIAVCGCYAQVSPDDVKAIEGVRVVLGTKERAHIVDYVEQAAREAGKVLDEVGDIMQTHTFEDIPLYDMPQRTRAFLKIEDGCENFCSYCIIPYARGPVKSRQPAAVRREAEKLVAAGFKEICSSLMPAAPCSRYRACGGCASAHWSRLSSRRSSLRSSGRINASVRICICRCRPVRMPF